MENWQLYICSSLPFLPYILSPAISMHLRTTVAAWQKLVTVGNGQKARLAPGNTEGCSNVKVEIIQGKPLPNFKDDKIEAKNVKQLPKMIHLDIELHQEPASLTLETPRF